LKNPYRLPNPGKRPAPQEPEKKVTLEEYLAAKAELEELEKKYGIAKEHKEGFISRAISKFFDRRDAREQVKVNKKKDLWLCILLGWAGGHRFYQKQYLLGFMYLALCWCGFSMAMSIVDLLIIFPKQPDEDGNILM